MTAEEWARVTDCVNTILEQPESETTLLQNEAPGVRDEVVRLLTAHRAAGQDSTGEVSGLARVIGGRYQLQGLLGTGGSAAAWLGRDLETGQRVVVKLPKHGGWFGYDLSSQFQSEAAILRGLQHPGIAPMLDCGATAEGAPFLVMPYLEGPSLRTLMGAGPIEPVAVATLVEQMGETIHAAHRARIIHRDLKPENIMIQRVRGGPPRAVLMDFGLTMFGEPEGDSGSTTRFFAITRYMAPEQVLGKAVMASDVYALALIVYEMWTGRPLFDVGGPVALYERQRRLREEQLESGTGRDLARPLRAALWRGLQWDSEKRPEAGAFAGRVAQEIQHPGRRWFGGMGLG